MSDPISDPIVERFTAHCLRVPLTRPYKLSFGPVEAFDMVLVEAELDDGRSGWGEATVLTGYTEETIEEAWQTAGEMAEPLVGLGVAMAKNAAMAHQSTAPFTTTAFVTALEMATGHSVLTATEERRMELLAILNAMEADELVDEIEARLDEGYKTLKVKVGFDLGPDMARLAYIQECARGRAKLRVDANQGYDRSEGVVFVSCIDPAGIELVEQTCAAGDWKAAVAVADAAGENGVPCMLDESIYKLSDVDRAAKLGCADVIKLKLMKLGSLDALARGIDHIRAQHMTPVLGNGVAGDIGCWMEACVGAASIDNAGEMNGFLKPIQRLFDVPMRLERGELILDGGEARPDRDAIATYTLEKRETYRK